MVDQKKTLEGQIERLQNDYTNSLSRIKSAAENFRNIKFSEIQNTNDRTAKKREDLEELASQDSIIKLAKINALEEDIVIQIQNKRDSFTGIIEDESDNLSIKRQINNKRINELEKNIQFQKNQLDDVLKNPGLKNFFSGREGELKKQIVSYEN